MSGRRKLLVTVHVVAAASNTGAIVVTFVLLVATVFTGDRAFAGWPPRLGELCVFAVDVPLLIAALLTGVVTALMSPWGLFRHSWVVKKLGLTLANLVIALAAVGPWIGAVTAAGGARWIVLAGLEGRIGGRQSRPADVALRPATEIKARAGDTA